MKKIILIAIAIIFFANIANAQRKDIDRKNIVGISFALGDGVYNAPGSIGGGSYQVENFHNIGLDYSRVLSRRWDFCSGFEFTHVNMWVTPAFLGYERPPFETQLNLATIPAQMKFHFARIFYVNGGMLFNISTRTSETWYTKSRSGEYELTNHIAMLLGFGGGIGAEYELFNTGIILSANSYIRTNGVGGIGSFQSAQVNAFRLWQSGVRFGVGYRF